MESVATLIGHRPPNARPNSPTPYIIGADEVGRGSIAGPLCVGAFLSPVDMERIPGAGDSKQSSLQARQFVLSQVQTDPQCRAALSTVPPEDITRDGMTRSLWRGYRDAIDLLLKEVPRLGGEVVAIRIDGSPMKGMCFYDIPLEFIIKGDLYDWRIGTASMVAKILRDDMMNKLHKYHKRYNWMSNKGYGTKDHIAAIKEHGLTPHHRVKFCRKFVPEGAQEIEPDRYALIANP